MGPRLTGAAALVVLLAGLLAGCSEQTFATPRVEPAASPTVTADLTGTFDAAAALTRRLGVVRARCLEAQGYDEVREALDLRRPPDPTFDHRPLEATPVEFGPATAAEARSYGMVGTEVGADPGDVGAVVANDPGFAWASGRCDDWIYDVLAPGLRELQTRSAAFQDEVTNDFLARVAQLMTPVLVDRARCVRRSGYPTLSPRTFLDAPSMAAIVEAAGAGVGTTSTTGAEPPRRDQVPRGDVLVVAPIRRSYEPSDSEVALALVYVECGDRVGFDAVTGRASRRAGAAVARTWRGDSDALRGELVAALGRLHS